MRTIAVMLLAVLGFAPAFGLGAGLSGTVTRVADGDTFWVRPDDTGSSAFAHSRKPLKVRLQGIDAPERCQAWGPESKAALESRILHRKVRLQVRSADDYRRSLATLELDGEDVGAWMVGRGHAWSARFHRSPGAYAAQERAARDARRGLFADKGAIEPRAFRKNHGACP
jgi:micrococcal nuclease